MYRSVGAPVGTSGTPTCVHRKVVHYYLAGVLLWPLASPGNGMHRELAGLWRTGPERQAVTAGAPMPHRTSTSTVLSMCTPPTTVSTLPGPSDLGPVPPPQSQTPTSPSRQTTLASLLFPRHTSLLAPLLGLEAIRPSQPHSPDACLTTGVGTVPTCVTRGARCGCSQSLSLCGVQPFCS